MSGFAEKLDLDALSDDAKAIAGVWFARMTPKSDGVTLQMRQLKPSLRTQAALDELVERGAISVAPFNRFGGLVYKPLVDCWSAFTWFATEADRDAVNFQLMVPVSDASL